MSSPAASRPAPAAELAALPAALLAGRQGFRSDSRYARRDAAGPVPEEPLPESLESDSAPGDEAADPIMAAWSEGYAAGMAEAQAAAAAQAVQDDAAREAVSVSLARLDAESLELLRRRLHAIVIALCEDALRPLALDQAALATRVERAVGLLARADDQRLVRLHPDDIAFLPPALREQWRIEPDPALGRGAVRVESEGGGVEDGPQEWHRAIAEALASC